jgi:hypothetical protein
MDNPETLAEFSPQDTEKTEGKEQSGMDNPETLAEFGTQDTEKTEGEGTIRNGQPRDTGRIWYTRHRENRRGKGQLGMDNTDTLAEFGQDTWKTERQGTIRNGQHRDTGRI